MVDLAHLPQDQKQPHQWSCLFIKNYGFIVNALFPKADEDSKNCRITF
jgi:hypothetical protein